MTYLTRACCVSLGCDRVFLLDADEFLDVRTREDLDAALAPIPYESHALIAWRTYVPTACDDAAEPDAFRRIVRRRVAEPVPMSKVAVSRTILRRPDAIVVQGNHAVASRSPDCSSAPLTGVFIAHFPVRSVAQLKLKVLAGWNAYLAMGYEFAGLGYQWRELYERIYSGARSATRICTHAGLRTRCPCTWTIRSTWSLTRSRYRPRGIRPCASATRTSSPRGCSSNSAAASPWPRATRLAPCGRCMRSTPELERTGRDERVVG